MPDTVLEYLDEIGKRCKRATGAPWVDFSNMFWEACKAHHRRARKWWHGSEKASKPIFLIARPHVRGKDVIQEDIPVRVDYYDFEKIIGLRWSEIKGNICGGTSPHDIEFIVAARTDLPKVCEMLREAIDILRDHGLSGGIDVLDRMAQEAGDA